MFQKILIPCKGESVFFPILIAELYQSVMDFTELWLFERKEHMIIDCVSVIIQFHYLHIMLVELK